MTVWACPSCSVLIQIAHAMSQIFEKLSSILRELKMAIYDIHDHLIDDFKHAKYDVQEVSLESVAT